MSDKLSSRMFVNTLGIPGILLVIWFGGIWFTLFMSVVLFLAITEFFRMNTSEDCTPKLWLGWVATFGFIWMYSNPHLIIGITHIISIILLFIFFLLIELFSTAQNSTRSLGISVLGILYVPLLLGTLISLRIWDIPNDSMNNQISHVTFGLFVSIWVCDSAAYLIGKKWGKRKIFERVSPNKTIVGSIAGFIGAGAVFYLMHYFQILGIQFDLKDIFVFTMISGVFGQIGDFVESKFKRDVGVKDTSQFLMGHGGVLDRFDSLIFASPLLYSYLILFH